MEKNNQRKFTPIQLPPRTYWTLPVNMPRAKVGKFCKCLAEIIEDIFGCVFTYPELVEHRNRFRGEWYLACAGNPLWFRLGLIFEITDSDLKSIEAYAAYAENHPRYGEVPAFTAEEMSMIHERLATVLEQVLDRMDLIPADSVLRPIYYLLIPIGCEIGRDVFFEFYQLQLNKTLTLSNGIRVSSMHVAIHDNLKSSATRSGLVKVLEFAAIATLATGQPFKRYSMSWPKNRKVPTFYDDGIDSLFPKGKWKKYTQPTKEDTVVNIQEVTTALSHLNPEEYIQFISPLFAYAEGVELFSVHPTLSVIAFLAALSAIAGSKKRSCEGELSCSIHGPLAFKHDEVSETAAVIETVEELIPFSEDGGFARRKGSHFGNQRSGRRGPCEWSFSFCARKRGPLYPGQSVSRGQ